MKILFAHQNFPGQYLPLARHLGAQGGHEIVFLTQRQDAQLPGVRKILYQPKRKVTAGIHHYLRETEAGVLNGQEVLRACLALRDGGFTPDVMLGHNGWGEIWYLKDVYPQVPLIGYFEFFYRYDGADVGFEPDHPPELDTGPRVRTKNLGNLIGLDAADLGQCPTHWQKSLYPERFQSMLHVVHEGVDTRIVAPDPTARLRIPGTELEVCAGDPIVTYVARNLEPYRGFPSFMRALPRILSAYPNARVLIVGGDGVSYGVPLPDGRTYRQQLIEELGDSLDLSRVNFLGKLPYTTYLDVLKVSAVHVYLTYPFVLSWSMIEALSAGCLVVGSRTPPVQEVIRDGRNGLLVDIFDPDQIARQVCDTLADPSAFAPLRTAARRTAVEQYDLQTVCLPAQLRLLRLAAPPPQESIWAARRAS